MTSLEFTSPVPRWVRVRGHSERDDPSFDFDEDGFLPAPRDLISFAVGSLVRPQSAADVGALVLLGEPGSGKTTTFEQLTGEDFGTPPPPPGDPGTVWVIGSELTDSVAFRETVGDHLTALPNTLDGGEPGPSLTIVLDQLDESAIVRGLPRHLERALAGKDTRSLRVFVACRTADYPRPLTQVLKNALDGCVVADLAPLTRADAEDLASSVGVNGPIFAEAVVANGVGMLASVPLTLKVLLGAYREDPGSLDQGSLKLFERGVARLADEHDRDRLQGQALNTSVEERVVIASRIASRMVLSGQRTVWTGDLASASAHDLTLGMLAGGDEHASSSFPVTNAAVNETLKSALFTRNDRNRVAFTHSSFGAFLAARYLAARLSRTDAAQRQLSEMFLVAAPDEDSASIPVYLRETAAWLVARAPAEHQQLASADPEGLMAYSAHITDPEVRERIVEGLLQRADEIELTHPSWQRTRWRLGYPGLAEKLRTVLNESAAAPGPAWSSLAKVSLAVELSRHCSDETLAEPLLHVAEASEWPIAVRQQAAKAAMGTAAVVVAPRLQQLLADLAVQTQGEAIDHEELVGTLLSLLWPQHLQLAEVLPHVHPTRTPRYFGTYRSEILRLPQEAADADLAELLRFARGLVVQVLQVPEGESLVGTDQASAVSRSSAANAAVARQAVDEIVLPILDRVTSAATAHQHLPAAVELIAGLQCASAQMAMPAGFDWVDADGVELETTAGLRRSAIEQLAQHLLEKLGAFTRAQIYLITSRWKRHSGFYTGHRTPAGQHRGERQHWIGSEDVSWLLERAQFNRSNGSMGLGEALILIASQVADLRDPQTLELVYTLRDTTDWQYFPWLQAFESPQDVLAAAPVPEPPATAQWEHADEFAALQRGRLAEAAHGNTEAFWLLVSEMTIDPSTGQNEPILAGDADLFALPGAKLWSQDDLRTAFSGAAHLYLASEHDHRDRWLGAMDHIDWRAEAGYAALRFLHREGDLAGVPPERWSAWVGSIMMEAHRSADPDAGPSARDLFATAIRYARSELADALGLLVRTALANGQNPWQLTYIVSMLPATMYRDLTDLASEIRSTLETPGPGDELTEAAASKRDAAVVVWEALLHPALTIRDPAAVQLAEEGLNGTDLLLALAAGRALLTTDASAAWSQVHAAIVASDEFALELAKRCAFIEHTNAIEGGIGITEALNDEDLAAAFQWVAAASPPASEVYEIGVMVGADGDRRLHDWRNRILRVLSERGTVAAVLAIRSLVEAYPEDLGIKAALVAARREAQARRAVLLKPEQVIDLLADPERRVISTGLQLAEVVVDTLVQIGKDLESHWNVLWDRERLPVPSGSPAGTRRIARWRPKREGTLAAYIAHELRLRLVGRRIVINREVVIKPTDDGDSGERPDILVEAVAADETFELATTVTVPIEIKGSWHEKVLTAQRDQLAKRYLRAIGTEAGVYLVGWYPLELWDADDRGPKSRTASLGTRQQLIATLTEQAAEIQRDEGVRTLPCVLTIARASAETFDDELVE